MILSLFDRLPDSLGDDRRIFVQSERHRPLEALWASNDHPHSASKWIDSNPAFVWLFDVLATGPRQPLMAPGKVPAEHARRAGGSGQKQKQKQKQRWHG